MIVEYLRLTSLIQKYEQSENKDDQNFTQSLLVLQAILLEAEAVDDLDEKRKQIDEAMAYIETLPCRPQFLAHIQNMAPLVMDNDSVYLWTEKREELLKADENAFEIKVEDQGKSELLPFSIFSKTNKPLLNENSASILEQIYTKLNQLKNAVWFFEYPQDETGQIDCELIKKWQKERAVIDKDPINAFTDFARNVSIQGKLQPAQDNDKIHALIDHFVNEATDYRDPVYLHQANEMMAQIQKIDQQMKTSQSKLEKDKLIKMRENYEGKYEIFMHYACSCEMNINIKKWLKANGGQGNNYFINLLLQNHFLPQDGNEKNACFAGSKTLQQNWYLEEGKACLDYEIKCSVIETPAINPGTGFVIPYSKSTAMKVDNTNDEKALYAKHGVEMPPIIHLQAKIRLDIGENNQVMPKVTAIRVLSHASELVSPATLAEFQQASSYQEKNVTVSSLSPRRGM